MRDPDRQWDRDGWAVASTAIAREGIAIVAAYIDRKAIDLYVDLPPSLSSEEAARRTAHAFALDEYEFGDVDSLDAAPNTTTMLANPHEARVNRVWAEPGGMSLRVEVTHRADETVQAALADETDERVRVRVIVGTPPSADRYVISRRMTTTAVTIALRAPLGQRQLSVPALDSGRDT